MRRFRSLLLVLGLALSIPACSGAGDDGTATGDDANLTKLAASEVKVEGKAIDFGKGRTYSASVKDKARIHAVPFAGNAGDSVTGESRSKWAGTLYVLKKVGADFAVVGSAKADAKKTATVTATLRTGGSFFLGFEAKAPKTAGKTAVATVSLKLDGAPASTDGSFIGKLKTAYDEGASQDFTAINEGDLPAPAKKDWNKLNKDWGPDYPPTASTWELDGKTIYVVENDNDGGMSITFYDAKGGYLTGGSAGESSEFRWD